MRSFPLMLCMGLGLTSTAIAQEAYVYDYMPQVGVYVYGASSTGKLTPIAGSPFHPNGEMVGTNGRFFVTADSTTVYAYEVESNGGIGKLVSSIDTQVYGGARCGTVSHAGAKAGEYDHAGQNLYILTSGVQDEYGYPLCEGLQTYGISKTGILTFKGSTEFAEDGYYTLGLPTLTGNGQFGFTWNYSVDNGDACSGVLGLFRAESNGVLQYQNEIFDNVSPTPPSEYSQDWILSGITDDRTNHIAMAMNATTDSNCNDGPDFGPGKLASYTVDSQGNLTTTNTYATMPTLPNGWGSALIKMDPSGRILAAAVGTGVAFYHFNGGDPITPITGIIGKSGSIARMAWDNDGHLYAQNGDSGKLHVYQVTRTSAKELTGSPTVIPQSAQYAPPSSIIVRTK